MRRLLAGEAVVEAGPALPAAEPLAPELERLYVTLCSAVVPMLAGGEGGDGLQLARAACEGDNGPTQLLGEVGDLLDLASSCSDRDALRPLRTPGFDLVLTAALLARTPDVAGRATS